MSIQNVQVPALPGRAQKNQSWFITQVTSIIEQQGCDPGFGVPQLARHLGVSRTQLNRKLVRLTGCPPGRLIVQFRIRTAAQLLREGRQPVKEVAWLCGFQGHTSFCRSFYQEYQCNPSRFRSHHQPVQEAIFCWKLPFYRADMEKLLLLARQTPWLLRLLQIILPQLDDETLRVDTLARALCISTSGLHRKIKTLFNIAPQRFITDLRLLLAAELLAQRTGPVAEVAYKAGFFDQAHLCRHFKAVFGCQPSAYKGENGHTASVIWLEQNLVQQTGK